MVLPKERKTDTNKGRRNEKCVLKLRKKDISPIGEQRQESP